MKNIPLVTIGLTTYNRPDLLKEAVRSVLNQTFTDFVLIIGNDDPSSPVTFETLEMPYDHRVEILNYSSNIGEISNMNNMLELAKTKWFTWLADDDIFHSQYLELLIKTLQNKSYSVSAVYCGYLAGDDLNESFFHDVTNSKLISLTSHEFIPKYVSRKINLQGNYGLLNTENLKKIGGMPSLGNSFGPYSDTLIPILLSETGCINYIDSPLCFLRTHMDSESASSSNFEAFTTAEIDFLKRLIESCNNVGSNLDINQCIFNMVSWFRDNEFSVISRNSNMSRIKVVTSFISYQVRVNYLRIKIKFWSKFTIDTLVLLFKVIMNSIYKKIRL